MSLSRLTARVPATAAFIVSHPLESAGRAAGFAKGVVAGGVGFVKAFRTPVPDPPAAPPAPPAPTDAAPERPAAAAPPAPTPVPEPPVDVVEQALAAEAASEETVPTAGMQGEPHPVTREEIHEGAALTRAERDEIDEETAEGLGLDEDEALTDDDPLLDPAVASAVRSEHLRNAGQQPG